MSEFWHKNHFNMIYVSYFTGKVIPYGMQLY